MKQVFCDNSTLTGTSFLHCKIEEPVKAIQDSTQDVTDYAEWSTFDGESLSLVCYCLVGLQQREPVLQPKAS